jgi:HSF-type DNA-binding
MYYFFRYFRQTKLTSFQRQLNLYGFNRITRGADSGAYYCELFLRYRVFLCKRMIRTKVKGTRFKAASNPENEPDFYSMPFVTSPPMEASQCEAAFVPSTVQTNLPQHSVNLEPIPLVYSMQASSLQQLLNSYSQTDFSSKNQVSLDDSGSEDYLLDSGSEGLEDFSIDWDPAFDETFEMTLKDDIQLGFMLDKLLEE